MGIDTLYKAIAAECRAVIPGLKRVYRDNIPQNMELPCILVLTVSTEPNRRLDNRQRMKQSFDVQYFPVAEIQNRRKECEAVKQEMLRHFDVIGADSVSFYVRERDTNITDDVLHFLFSVTYTEYKATGEPRMEDMKTNVEMEE